MAFGEGRQSILPVSGLVLEPDPKDLAFVEQTLRDFPKEIPKVLARSLDAAGRTARTQIAKAVKAETGIKSSVLKRRIWFHRARGGRLVAKVISGAVGWKVGAVTKKYYPTKHGVEVRLGRMRFERKGGFAATMPATGYRSAFRRQGPPRLPIEELRTRSVTRAVRDAAAVPTVMLAAQATLSGRLRYLTQNALKRALKKGGHR